MFTQQEYLYGWIFYLSGAAVLILCIWWLTSAMRSRELRQLIRLIVSVSLLVPWYTGSDLKYFAPAWVMAGFEAVFEHNFWRAGGPWLMALTLAVALALVAQIVVRAFSRQSQSQPMHRVQPKKPIKR
jgi:hypothetical protein